jgi:hypothetical protein
MRKPRLDLYGKQFGKLTVLDFAGNSKWLCKCQCGNEVQIWTANLTRGNSKSCGCIRNIKASKRATIHGYFGTKVYRSWLNIKRRCLDSRYPSYKEYGAKGVTIYEPWINDIKAFADYIGEPPSEKHSVDRINNSKGYEPGNIRWADKWEQANNKTNNVKVIFQEQEFSSISAFCRWVASQCNIDKKHIEREFQRNI